MDAETKTVIKNIAQIQVEALTHISKNFFRLKKEK